MQTLISCAVQNERHSLSFREQEVLKHFPKDICSVRQAFDLEPVVTVYATCPNPKCCCTYAPEYQDNIAVYLSRCHHKKHLKSKPCNTRLTTTRVEHGESVRAPLRPFVVQDFHAFVAGLLSRPGMEEMICKGREILQQFGQRALHGLRDIADGSVIADLKGPDGNPFVDSHDDELRIVWSLSVDWFNPYLNKISGLKVSTGSMAMVCLFLPPSLRYKADNIFLAGIIPGPNEPPVEVINHFLRPLVDKLLASWETGVWYSRTHCFPRGRRSRSAVAAVVTDLPGARKIGGQASHSAKCFCSQCHLKKRDINNIDTETWKTKTGQEILEAAVRWRDTQTDRQRKEIFKEVGVRWSELMRLPYWDPIK